ncbi:hypothetical protein EVG20_g8115 [Dentipellis fragilis]|uniref:Uncharacterized protein n=1 Tax=Dentipellis fragilis TaxID=205917 RepID=A0A4Y9Y7N9_9AGAM|nr:hypothetical protein EVG20_g8115 [Dentipellis fragilis]
MCGEKYFAITISDLWAMSVLYGLYVALFGGSVYVLIHRRRSLFYAGSSIALFLLITTFVAISLVAVLVEPAITASSDFVAGGQILQCSSETSSSDWRQESLSSYIHLMAKTAIQMCIKYGISFALRFLFADKGSVLSQMGFYNSGGPSPTRQSGLQVMQMADRFGNANTMTELASNAIMTALIAYRIWSLARTLEKTLGKTAGVRYRTALCMVVESGSVILVSQVLDACLGFAVSAAYTNFAIDIGVMLTVIAPTLIIVRVGMGQGFDSVVETSHQHHASHQYTLRPIRFAQRATINTDSPHVASLGAMIQEQNTQIETRTDLHRDARTADSGDVLGQVV